MFEEKDFQTVGFESSWEKKKLVEEQGLQTTEFSMKDKNINTNLSKSIEIQTDPIQNSTEVDVDMDKLAKWLNKIMPSIVNELNDTSLSIALAASQTYKPSALTIKILQKVDLNETETINNQETYVSALSWSCTGNTIAVSCSFKHDIWCYHQGIVKIFSFVRNEQLSDIPNKKLKCGSCVSTLNFHPLEPSILAGGTISGEVYLWNLQNDRDSVMSTFTAHDDRITQVSWITNSDLKSNIVLVSASLDSYLTVWKIYDSTLNVDQRYKCQYFTSKLFNSNVDMIPKKTDRGIVCFDFSTHFPGIFVVGMEGGYILKCSLIGAKLVSGNKSTVSTLDPFVNSFNSHDGEITNISFSPHRKDLFFSCGTDDQIKIFHIDQESPVQIIFFDSAINSTSWILCESKLIVCAGQDGSLKLFSMLNGQQINTNINSSIQSLTSMAVNNKIVNLLAVGNNEGILTLWSVPWNDIAIQDNKNVLNTRNSIL